MSQDKEASAKESWKTELNSFVIYKILTKIERSNSKGELFGKLAKESLNQAEIWKKSALPVSDQWVYKIPFQIRFASFSLKLFGPRFVLHFLPATKVRGLSVYRGPDTHYQGREASERVHSKVESGTNLRAATFGMNDGLVSNASLVFAMVGAGSDNRTIIIAGISGLLAGSFSMAAGEYISVKSQTELYENQIKIEELELAEFPEEEVKELSLIYQAKGIDKETADKVSESLIRDPKKALDTLVREELGLNPNDLGSGLHAAVTSFISFSIGAILPLVPFLLLETPSAFPVSITLSTLVLFGSGVLISFLTGKSALKNGLRMCALGWIAGLVSYGIGHLLGMSAS